MKTTHRKKILLIERYDSFRESLAELLALEGFWVLTAKKGRMGLMLAREYRPDVIICARSFWDNNCWDILQELRKEEPTSTTPFIFLSSKPASSMHEAMQDQQNVYTLIKPFQTEQLIRLLKVCLADKDSRHPSGALPVDQLLTPPQRAAKLPLGEPFSR